MKSNSDGEEWSPSNVKKKDLLRRRSRASKLRSQTVSKLICDEESSSSDHSSEKMKASKCVDDDDEWSPSEDEMKSKTNATGIPRRKSRVLKLGLHKKSKSTNTFYKSTSLQSPSTNKEKIIETDQSRVERLRLQTVLKLKVEQPNFSIESSDEMETSDTDPNKRRSKRIKKAVSNKIIAKRAAKAVFEQNQMKTVVKKWSLASESSDETETNETDDAPRPKPKSIKIHGRAYAYNVGDKPFVCKDCERSFAKTSHRKEHMKNCARIMEKRPNKCPLCPNRYSTKYNLNNHMKFHHPEVTD